MFQQLTTAYLIFSIAVIVTSQVYEDLESTYGVPDVPTDDESVGYGDDYDKYGDENVTDNYDYGGHDDYDYDSYFVNVSFSAERLKELYTCLCLGASMECNIHYSINGHNWIVNLIEKIGSFHAESEHCKYYRCSHVTGDSKITCGQVEQRSSACSEAGSAQFFQQKTHDCCGSTCVGIFWSSVDEQLSFLQNSSDIESCEDSCLCPTNGEGGTRVTKVTDSNLSNSTSIDKFIIYKTASSPLITSITSTSSSTKLGSIETVTQYGNSTSHGVIEINSAIIVAVVAAIVAAIIIAVCILVAIVIFRRRNPGCLKQSMNNNTTEPGNAVFNSGPQFSNASSNTVTEAPVTLYSPIVTDNLTSANHHEYPESTSKNGGKDLNISNKGGSHIYKPREKIFHSKSRPYTQTKIDPNIDSSFEPKHPGGKFGENANNNHGDVKHDSEDRQDNEVSEGQDGGKRRVNDNLDSSNRDSVGLICDRSDLEKWGLVRKDGGINALTGGKESDEQESRKPLLTFHEIQESVV